jgi:hypothetical protein
MSIANEILGLRRNQISSVTALLAAIEWTLAAPIGSHSVARSYAAAEAADIVLLNVAAHAQVAAELLNQTSPKPPRKTRRSTLPWRKSHHSDKGPLSYQRRLFA